MLGFWNAEIMKRWNDPDAVTLGLIITVDDSEKTCKTFKYIVQQEDLN